MPSVERALPVYQQVVRYYAEKIARGDLAPGDKLPSGRELMETWQISKSTANRIIEALRSEGLAETRVGVGTTVAARTEALVGIGPRDMFRRMYYDGQIRLPGERSIRTMGCTDGPNVPSYIVETLGGTIESEFIWRRRVILRDDQPYSVAVSWFLPAIIAQKGRAIIDRLLSDQPIPEGTPKFVADVLDTDLTEVHDQLSAVSATEEISKDLQIEVASPMLYLVSTICAGAWGPIEAGEYFYPAQAAVNYRYEL